jgi:NAD(P)-dependent dehydrogenase (short-subunit alcohol dehydrogenase family)
MTTSATSERVLIIGNSDGIGLALTRLLLAAGRPVVGVSRSPSPIADAGYEHHVADIMQRDSYRAALQAAFGVDVESCVFCAGIGDAIDLEDMSGEAQIFDVNLTGAVIAAVEIVPQMVKRGRGHFVGLSSLSDDFINAAAPSYSASKAGLSSYLHGLARAVQPHGVSVTNIRFGFVDTKMAKADSRPFMISAEKAAELVQRCLRTKPVRYTYPTAMALLMAFIGFGQRLRLWL